jgi:hypothetical protein
MTALFSFELTGKLEPWGQGFLASNKVYRFPGDRYFALRPGAGLKDVKNPTIAITSLEGDALEAARLELGLPEDWSAPEA